MMMKKSLPTSSFSPNFGTWSKNIRTFLRNDIY
jgi:hypothetical protein